MINVVLVLCTIVISSCCVWLYQRQKQVEADYHNLLNTANEAIWIVDVQGRTTYVNPSLVELFGYTKEEMLARPVFDFIDNEVDVGVQQHLAGSQQAIKQQSILFRRQDGSPLSGVVSTTPRLDRQGVFIGTLIVFTDMTQNQQAQEELRSLQDQLQQQVQMMDTILSVSPDHFYLLDRDGRLLYASRAGLEALGLQKSESIGKTEQELGFPPELVEEHQNRRAAVFATGETLTGQTSVPMIDGIRQREYMMIPIPDASGSVQFVVVTSRDVTEKMQTQEELRQYRSRLEELVAVRTAELEQTIEQLNQEIVERTQAEEQLRQSEAYLAEAQKIAHIGSWEFDVATQAITWSDEVFRIFGLDCEQPAPTYLQHLQQIHPDDRELWEETVESAIAHGTCFRFDFRILRSDSSIRCVNVRGKVRCNPQGQVTQLYGTVLDITERKQAEEALRESEQRLRQIFDQAPIGIALATPDGQLRQVNQAFCQMLGYTEAQLMEINYVEITDPEDLVIELPYIEQCSKGDISSYQLEKRYYKSNGEVLLAHLTCTVLRDQKGKVIYGLAMIQDITEYKQAEQELQRQTQYRQLLAEIAFRIRDSLQIEVILLTTVTELQQLLQADRVLFYRLLPNRNGKVVAEAVVPGWQSLLGRELVHDCLEGDYLQQYQQEIHAWPDVEKAGFQACHLEMLREFKIRANLIVPIFLKDKIWGMLFVHQCSTTRQWNQYEIELLRQLADQLSIALTQAEMLEKETRHSQELARSNGELQQFAYVASHDLQEPLRTIASYAKLISRRYSGQLDEKGNRFIQYIMDEALRMQALINDLLKYSRVGRQPQNFTSCDCGAIFDLVVSRLEGAISESGATVTRSELPTVMADETQLVQLFQNLIGNAIKYRCEEPPVVQVAAQRQQREWLFWVRDNGIGIDPKYAERIFVIFQRLHTQEEYSGTGIGLAIASKIVERHGGRIWVESELGQGSTFYFTILQKEVSPFSLPSLGRADLP
ncbi:MAG TPA: PAS domain S-box protein [Cyanobacteria bacterium UBA8553]|nr:PAS domain S-box protein [Cyanobacteria bacterium UBA8553]